MDGCHDDSLTCLAMCLFVAGFSMIKSEKIKAQDKQMLNSFYCANGNTIFRNNGTEKHYEVKTTPKEAAFNYGLNTLPPNPAKQKAKFYHACMLMGGFGNKKDC